MKKIYNVMMLAAVAAAALVSCAKEMDKPEIEQKDGITVSLTTGSVETKTALSGSSAVWNNTDLFNFVKTDFTEQPEASITSIDGSGVATITGTVGSAGTYFAFYPKTSYGLSSDSAPGVVQRIKTAQTLTSPTSYDPAADILVSETFDVSPAGSTTPSALRFKRLGGFLKVSFNDKTTGSKLTGEYATKVSVQSAGTGAQSLAAKLTVDPTGIVKATGAEKTITATISDGVYAISNASHAAYLGVQPVTLPAGSTLTFKAVTSNYSITKMVTLPSDIVIGSGDIQPITVNVGDENIDVAVTRVWGKYSTNENYWNTIAFGGTASSDRNIAMDDEYIYLPETTAAAKMWRIPLDGITDPSLVNVEGVAGGTHALSCVRVVPNTAAGVNGGKDFLMASNLTTSSSATALTVYSWSNGTSDAPVSESVTNWRDLRLGDKFSVYGSLQDGALFFRDWNKTNGNGNGTILVLRMAWADVPSGGYFNPRITFSYDDTYENPETYGGINAYYPYPGDASNGFIANVSTSSKFASYAQSPLNTNPNSSGTFTESSGYYSNTAGYNYITFNGKKYIAYVKNAGDGDGRFYVLQGEASDTWQELLGAKRKVIYQADIQQNLAYADGEYHEDLATGVTKTSANSAIDCAARVIGDDVYFAALKQGVGLSLFKLSLK